MRISTTRMLTALVLLFGLALLAVPTSAAPPAAGLSSVAEVATYRGADRQAKLEAGARTEGALMIYTSMDLEESQPILEAFMRKYPFIHGEIYRASSADVAQKIITEYRGGKFLADIFEGDGTHIAEMINEQYGQAFYTPRAGAYGRQAKDPNGFWVATRYNMFAAAWNTNIVSPADAPKTYEDLLDPKWRGKIGIEADSIIWMATLLNYWGETKAMDFFSKLGAQQPLIRKGHTLLSQLIVAGEVPMSPTMYDHRPELLKAKRAPIDWRPLQPVVAVPQVISLPKNAPHPHAAMLFVDFLLSPDGQQFLAQIGRIPAHPLVLANPPYLSQGFTYRTIDPSFYLKNSSRYAQLWQDLIVRRH